MKTVYKNTLKIVLALLVASGLAGAQSTIELEYWFFNPNKETLYQQWYQSFAEVRPDVTIRSNVIPQATYHQSLAAAQIAGEGPALFTGQPLGHPTVHFNNGQALDLTSFIDDEWRAALYPSTLDYLTVNGRVLSMSFATNNAQIYYNVDRFNELGLEPPETMDELRTVVETLREAGFGGIHFLGAAPVQSPLFFLNAAQQLYPEEFRAADQGEGRWDIPEFVEILEVLASYNDVWNEGVTSINSAEAQDAFANGQVSMLVHGSWVLNGLQEFDLDFEMGIFPFPSLMDGMRPAALGSLSATTMVSSQLSDAERDAAIEFLRWIAINGQADEVRELATCPAGPVGESGLEEAHPLARDFCDDQIDSVPRDMVLQPVRDALSSSIQGLLIGRATPEQVLRDAQQAKDRIR